MDKARSRPVNLKPEETELDIRLEPGHYAQPDGCGCLSEL